MIPRKRSTFSAIVDRPPLKLPDGARIVVWTIVNLEFWSISRPMPRQVLPAPTGQVLLPDVPNWAWHEYGMRVGVWRFFELLGRPSTLACRSMRGFARNTSAWRMRRAKRAGNSWAMLGSRCRSIRSTTKRK